MKRAHDPAPRASISGALVASVLKLVWAAFVIATPLIGAWAASSIAAYKNGPTALSAAIGLLLFPALPLAWDAWAERRRRRALKGIVKPRFLTLWDRLILRTLAINLLFLSVLLGVTPETGFTALSSRGDWMLDGLRGQTPDAIRKVLFRAADKLEWLYVAVRDNPFRDMAKDQTPVPVGTGTAPQTTSTGAPPPLPSAAASQDKPSSDKPSSDKPSPGREARTWPAPAALHPAVAEMPASAETSIVAVARYLADRESDRFRLVKALHDWVADRIAYDAPSYAAHKYPPQDAESVFRTRKSVCAGYAQLLTELGKQAGVEIVYVVGDARTEGQRERGEGHAWNAVKIEGRYYLVDATWDSGSVSGTTFKKGYRTEYFLTPPEVFGLDHFPDDARWQLREKPISRGDFMRQPMMSPAFYAEGRELVSPDRSQVTVKGSLTVEMKNPKGLFTLASFIPTGSADPGPEARTRCTVEDGPLTKARCDFPSTGSYTVLLFSNDQRYGTYHFIGQVGANNGG